ncbi:MAG: hypothetical protein JJU26_09940, partial [Oceanicaulis sp.]|nr:hypothetical protein [Oceanicaulis sp.]
MSTMLAGAYAGYGNRAYAQQVCTHQSGTTYLCDGATILEQTFFGENIIVVTGDNLEVDTTAPGSFGGNAFSLGDSIFGISGAVSFIDIDGATLTAGQDYAALSIFGGGDYNYYGTLYPGSITVYTNGTLLGGHTGLYAYNNGGTGSVDITVNGSVTGTGYYGIRARNANAGGDLIITTGAGSSVSGGYSGILAENNGQGALAITANGDVTGASYVGISAQNHGTDLTVTTGTGTTVAGGEVGIAAVNSGSGQLTVTAGGDVTGTAYYGIVAQNQGTGLSVTTHAGSSVVGGFSGIEARNFGSGALDITADGDVTGLNGYGIRAQNNGTILTVTAGTGISVSGDLFGIHAQNYGTDLIVATGTGSTVTGNGGAGIVALNHGSGLLAVTAGGDVAGAVYYGILAQNQGADLSVTTEAGSSVVGDFNGIEARNFGSGMLTVSADGDVTGLSGYGIRARGYGTGLVVTTGAESAISGDTTGIYASNTGSGAVTIDAQGDVEATNASGTGIHAANFTGVDADGNSINITTGGTIEGTGLGIYAVNHASGAVNIISTGDVLNSSSGILAYNTSLNGTGTSISIEAARVTTQLSAIYALNNGTGALSIVTTGDITSMNGRGIVAFQAGSDVDIVTLAGTTVSGGMRGISSINGGTGALTIMAGGGVYGTGNNSRGIFAWNTVASTTDLTVTTAAGTTISSVMGGISALNSGSGAVTINAQGDVHATHAYSTGIEAFNNNGVDADGNSINLNAAGTVTGGWAGIYAHNYGPGAVNIVSTGDVSSDVGAGIFAYNVAGTDLNITAAQTTGYRAGIDAIQAGTARLTILATGNVSALAAYGPSIGIWARSDSSGSGIDITTAANTAVNAGATGISARNNGAGALTVTAGGDVTGTGNTGIYTRNQGTDLIVTTGAGVAVSGGDFGIASINDGTGELTVTADGDLTGSNFYGIFAQNSGTDLTITLGMGAAVTGGYDAIEARNFGSGALTITTDGNITGLSRSGIFARSFGSGISIAAALGANITGATHGIRAQNSGAGVIEIDVAAGSSVTSTGSGYAIDISGSEAIVSVAGALNGGAGGAIRFDDFDNQLTLHTGATINGDVVGGALDDSLSLVGVGTGTFNIGQLQNFEILAKDGTGHWILTGANTDAMSFALNAGRLTVDAALGFTDIAVSGGAILGGTGAIGGDVTVLDGGIIAPGASTGTLTVGNLFLSSGSVLDFELGMAGVVGGGVNDLIIVGNDLVLDGVLNITDVGGFGPGVYALITYGGDLTDNGLEFGILPGGVTANELLIQTAVTGEINLLSTFGATLGFWDGADPALHDNGVIDGGQGVWNTVNRNWTGMDGDVNGSWDGGFAVFQGVAGTVTVEGGVDFAGLQIRTDGYVIESGAGGVLNMTGAETILRVDAGVTGEVSAAIA